MMKRAAYMFAALALAALPYTPCAADIGDMWVDETIAGWLLSDLPPMYCRGGYVYGQFQKPLLYASAKYNPLYNYPMLFHSIMCRLQSYMQYGFSYVSASDLDEFDGCASPDDRAESAQSRVPTLSVRNKAVAQLAPFFAAGGVTSNGIITVGPLMHAYGGSPLCVWPASNVVDVTMGAFDFPTVPGANPLRAGVGRGGCFDVEAWLSCTNRADRPQGFHTARSPFGDLGEFLHDTLDPYFVIDWASKGVPTSAEQWCGEAYFLTNSPNYLSAEAVPTNVTAGTLLLEPWRRSWEALGGLACIAWHTNTNAFEYEAVDVWSNGVVSAASSNAFVSAMRQYMENGHPDLSNREYFPSSGIGVSRTQYYGPHGWNGASVRPNDAILDYQPEYIFYRGPYYHVEMPIPQGLTYDWTVTNINARTLAAPVSNRVEAVTNRLVATSLKKWKFVKVNEQGGEHYAITNGTATMDFGWGEREYTWDKYVLGPTSYDWEMVEEGRPVTHVELYATSNAMNTAVHASLVADSAWSGLRDAWSEDAGPIRTSTVCAYDDVEEQRFFVGEIGGKYGTGADDFLFALVTGGLEYWDVDELSASAHPMPREPKLACNGYNPPWWDTIWTGEGHNYTIRTSGPPQSYSSPGGTTNITYTATYTTPDLAPGEWWLETVVCTDEGSVVSKRRALMPGGDGEEMEVLDGAGYIPFDEAEAKSSITFTIDNECDLRYKVEWTPVRAWGVLNNVTYHSDWPSPNEVH